MSKWEYKSIKSWITRKEIIFQEASEEESFLNELGQKGWELTSVVHIDMGVDEKFKKTMYFKRMVK